MQNQESVRVPAKSFIVRVWQDGEGVPAVRGEIEYVSTGERRFFTDYWSLLNLLDGFRQDVELVG